MRILIKLATLPFLIIGLVGIVTWAGVCLCWNAFDDDEDSNKEY